MRRFFNILSGIVNQCRGAAQYHSQDQPFSFQKQVRFEDNTSSPDLKPNTGLPKLSSQPVLGTLLTLPNLSSHPHTSMLFGGTRTLLQNRTFDRSVKLPLYLVILKMQQPLQLRFQQQQQQHKHPRSFAICVNPK